ncbi:glycoside hydrolase family 2 TIM barrel-domain containing protein [Nonomuraea zeae]|uniref:Glycoside hydrolase family 2 protein n=1 Tax=Nonomuraea zeae TaxID=1642303 RepID=A0A5S4GFI3_9ACTN|nr:glycoside hydrolase family 2 TIM barrel-domain containing protein [Nonomuraea zeae]TMR31733.1 glycoside hydrolase family 2 protein [Nonomuraea zeae]
MIRTSFNDGWQFRPKVNPFAELSGQTLPYREVTLPHDAMLEQERRPDGEGANAYFPGGAYEYRKTFFVPEELRGKRIIVEFEGVYRDATVHVNGDYAGQRPYGYSCFPIVADPYLRYGQDNEIRVEARSHQDSRWYTGAGIYRDTWLLVGDVVRVVPGGVRISTPDVAAGRAVTEVATTIANDSIAIRTAELTTTIRDHAGNVVAVETAPVTVMPGATTTARHRLYVRTPSLWSPDSPHLYTCDVTLGELDTESVTFGIRTLQLDPEHGLRVNGQGIKLRGACVHHDNGVLGAATFARAEERRVELLKEAGFNAIRMSHQPMSTAMLNACDRVGMLVVDETFDMWTSGKHPFDYSLSFPEWWERDIEAMVAKDYNHPSVILYSIGNEIPETGTPAGAALARDLAEKVRALDGTRYLTNAVNTMLAVMSDLARLRQQEQPGINTAMADAGDMMNAIATSDLVTRRTAEAYAMLDVAGMNYADSRYGPDREAFPNRVILGTETFPTRIAHNWALVEQHGHVIGDFTWTGWDYLGEVGIGRPQYGELDRRAFTAPYPYLTAGCGDLDITGHRRPVSYYREIVYGLRTAPYLAVQRPEHHGEPFVGTPWAWSDAIASWTWPGFEGAPITVEVYAAADEVELLLDGRSLGRVPAELKTVFEAVYEPGELVAVAYRDGVEIGRNVLRTASDAVRLHAETDRPAITATGGDLAYVTLTLTDEDGTVHTAADRPVSVEVSGSGELIALGSADPSTEERFDAMRRRTYEGRALAIIRPTGTGKIRLRASAFECAPVEMVIEVRSA